MYSLITSTSLRTQFFILLALISLHVNAQKDWIGSFNVTHFSKTDYQGGTQNHDILQSAEGFIYVANNNGVLEYDGISWELHALPNKTICRSLSMSSDGRLFVGGQNELGYFTISGTHGWIWHDLIPEMDESDRIFSDVWYMEGKNNHTYIGTTEKLFLYSGDKMNQIHSSLERCNMFKCGGDVCLQDGEQIYIVQGNKLVPWLELPKQGLITKGLIRRGSEIVLSSEKNGMYVLQDGSWKRSRTQLNNYLMRNSINTVLQTKRATYIGTARGGLLTLDNKLENGTIYSIENGLNNNNVLSIFEDRDQNIWLGLDNGIDLIKQSSPFSNVLPDAPLNGAGYAAASYDDLMYLGTSNGLYREKRQNPDARFKPIAFTLLKGTEGQVYNIQEIRGRLLIAHHEGAFQLDRGYAQKISNIQGIWTFHQLSQNPNLMIAGTYEGLILFKWTSRGWRFSKKLEGLEESCRIITEDADGFIWISHPYRGAYRIDLDQRSGEILDVDLYTSKNGFPSNLHIYVSRIGNEIIFTSDNGLHRYDSKLDSIVPYSSFNEYIDKNVNIQRIFQDPDDNIWYVAANDVGVLKVSETSLEKSVKVLHIPELKGKFVAGFEFIYFNDEKEVFIGTDKGFLHLDAPTLFNRKFDPPTTFIKSVVLGGNDSLLWSTYGHGNSGIDLGRFNKDQSSFIFTFGTTRFADLPQITHSYWLEGFETQWTQGISTSQKEYTNLKPGNYTFHVKSTIAGSTYGPAQTVSFSIAPPWYASNGGLIILIAVLLLLITALIWLPRRKYVKELAQKERVLISERKRSEEEVSKLQKINLEKEVEFQNKELASATMHLVQKGKVLQDIKEALTKIQSSDANPENEIRRLIRTIDEDVRLDQNWDQFERHFDRVHVDFMQRLRDRYPQLTPNDHKLCAYLRMNLTTKEIATVLNISVRGVEISRYRLRKKLNLHSEENLTEFIVAI